MACELIPWQSYITGAILEPVDFTSVFDTVTCEDERKRLASHYQPTGGRRKLKRIVRLEPKAIDSRTLCFSDTVNLLAIFGRPNVDLNISSPGVIDIHAFRPRKRQCRGHWAENSVENVVASTVLQTSMTITHQINLLSTQYEWGRRAADFLPTRAHREPYVWATWNAGKMHNAALAVFTFPPWVFQDGDLAAFASANMFRDANPCEYGRNMWNVPQMLWAMIYDFCASHGIRHFVLTTYDKWIFGLFTEGYRTAYARTAMDHSMHSPTVLQTFMFWMEAGMRDP